MQSLRGNSPLIPHSLVGWLEHRKYLCVTEKQKCAGLLALITFTPVLLHTQHEQAGSREQAMRAGEGRAAAASCMAGAVPPAVLSGGLPLPSAGFRKDWEQWGGPTAWAAHRGWERGRISPSHTARDVNRGEWSQWFAALPLRPASGNNFSLWLCQLYLFIF